MVKLKKDSLSAIYSTVLRISVFAILKLYRELQYRGLTSWLLHNGLHYLYN